MGQESRKIAASPWNGMEFARLILFLLSSAFVGVMLYVYFSMPSTEKVEPRKVLNYTKAIYTKDYAVVCPAIILFDLRADADREITAMFLFALGREERMKKYGCEQWRDGIRVYGLPMLPPLDMFMSFSLTPNGQKNLVTLPGYLRNAE